MADNGPPAGGGSGAATKRRRRKRGGGSGGAPNSKDAPSSNKNGAKDIAAISAAAGGGRGGGNKGRKRGGGGRGGELSRMNKNASSPLQLPHVKVTLRNIGNVNKNGSVEGVVDSIRSFLDGAFPADDNGRSSNGNSNQHTAQGEGAQSSAYMMAWQMEKEDFEHNKNIFAELSSPFNNNSAAKEGSSTYDSSSLSIRAFSTGVYEEKSFTLPSNRQKLLPDVMPIVSEMNEAAFTSVNSMIDAAMSKMIQECGKQYINYVGGRVILDEESVVDIMLAEQIKSEMKKEKAIENRNALADDEAAAESAESKVEEDGTTTINDRTASVETVTKSMEKLSTSSDNRPKNADSAIRVRILSVTPAKKSKRRGEICARVQLVLYPPDPCFLFKDLCCDAGKMAAEKFASNRKDDKAIEMDKPSDGAKDGTQKTSLSNTKDPQIPCFPVLSSLERSRALARSRILINRTIEAMKLHAKSMNIRDYDNRPWQVFESPSQKTWKPGQKPMVGSIMAGTSLHDAISEHEKTKSNSVTKHGRGGFKSRDDRYDSTIENSDDYKMFMHHWLKDGAYPSKPDDAKKRENPIAFDDEGRPLSVIVMDIRKKQDEEAKKKAEAKAAAARAREAARSAQEVLKKKKEKKKKKKESDKVKRSERKKKAMAAASAPRAQPTLLQKASVPLSGFGA